LEIDHAAKMKVDQCCEAVLGVSQEARVFLDQIAGHESQKVGIESVDCILLIIEVVGQLLDLVRSEIFDSLGACLKDVLDEEFAYEGSSHLVGRLLAERENILHRLFESSILSPLANLQPGDDGSIELNSHEP